MSLSLCSWLLLAVPAPAAVWDLPPPGAIPLRHGGPVSSLLFTPDGKTLISGSGDGLVRLWDAAAGTERRRLAGHKFGVLSLALSRDGKTLASGSADGTIGLWDLAHGRLSRLLEGSHSAVRSLAFSPDGCWLASVDYLRCT